MNAPINATVRANYYANPFWADWFDPANDADAARAAVAFERVSELETRNRFDVLLATVCWLGLGLLLPLVALGNSSNSDGLVLWIMVLLVSPFVAVAFVSVRAHAHRQARADYERLLRRTFEGSWARYQCWLHGLAQADAHLYTQVMTWHQQQETQQQLRRIARAQETNANRTGLLVLLAAIHLGQHHR